MSGKDAAVQKHTVGGQAGKVTTGTDHKSTAAGHAEKAPKGSPSPVRVPKPPSPPPVPLPGKVSKSPNAGVGKERKPLAVVSRASSSENKAASVFEADKRPGKPKETSPKIATGFKIQGPEEKPSVKDADKRSDPLRKSKETPPKSASGLKIAGLEENTEAQKPLSKPRETPAKANAGEKNTAGKAALTLCSECRAASQGAVCFIGNDGRVSACSGRSAVYVCKSPKCAASNPEYVASLVAPPKKYLVSKRHLLKAQLVPRSRSSQMKPPGANQNGPFSPTEDQNGVSSPEADQNGVSSPEADQNGLSNPEADQNGVSSPEADQNESSSPKADQNGAFGSQSSFHRDESPEFGIEGLEDDDQSSDDNGEYFADAGSQFASAEMESSGGKLSEIGSDHRDSGDKLNGRRSSGSLRVRRRSMLSTQEQDAETVTLRKQMIQERKQAGEWMLNYAMEEAVQKLAPTGETKVKVLVEAFESIISHTDGEVLEPHNGLGTPEHQIVPSTKRAMHC